MSRKTVKDIRDYVRAYLDVDAEDMPDILLDAWIEEGEKRILNFERRWPFHEASWDLGVLGGQGRYPLGEHLPELRDIVAVTADDRELQMVAHRDAERTFTNNRVSTATVPSWYSLWGDAVFFWPKPSIDQELHVRGYRKVTRMEGAGGVGDWPEDFDETLQSWVLHEAFGHQDYLDLASFNKGKFEESLRELHNRFVMAPAPQPIILNGGSRLKSTTELRPGRYPWQ